MTEIHSIMERCKQCGMATVFAVCVVDLDDNGDQRGSVQAERVPHDRAECANFQALERETWPTLW